MKKKSVGKNLNPVFEQNYCSKTANGIYRTGHDVIRILKHMVYFDRSYGNISRFDLMASVLSGLNETSGQLILCRSKRQKINHSSNRKQYITKMQRSRRFRKLISSKIWYENKQKSK